MLDELAAAWRDFWHVVYLLRLVGLPLAAAAASFAFFCLWIKALKH